MEAAAPAGPSPPPAWGPGVGAPARLGWGCAEEPRGLRAVQGLEDPGDLQHDRPRLRVVHPLGAVQRVLQHVFKRCGETAEPAERPRPPQLQTPGLAASGTARATRKVLPTPRPPGLICLCSCLKTGAVSPLAGGRVHWHGTGQAPRQQVPGP